jgi:hypothetical protein
VTTAIGAYATTAALKTYIGKTDSGDDTLLGTICDRVNAFIESPEGTGRVIAPVASATYTFDGDGSNALFFPGGIRAISLLEIANQTGGTYATESSSNYFLRPASWDRPNGWPAMWIYLGTWPSTGHYFYPVGLDTVRVTMTTGWPAIPDDLTRFAIDLAARMWNRREVGVQDAEGRDEQGLPIVARFLAGADWDVLRAYARPTVAKP